MVKKISGTGSIKGPQEVTSISEINEVKEVSGVKAISGVSSVSGSSRVEGLGIKLKQSNQQEVLDTIDKEAQKIFAGKRIPRKRQKTITDALKMAVLAATAKDEDEEIDPEVAKRLKSLKE